MNRREAMIASLGAAVLPVRAADAPRTFKLWAFGDAHVGTDIKQKRESLAHALRQSEFGGEKAPPFDWDIAINVGDLSGSQGIPDDEEGELVHKQFGVLKKHPREAIYDISGNHDRNAIGQEEGLWFRKWVDPASENVKTSRVDPKQRPYPVEGTWERYSFRAGNLVFLMMSDRNEPTQLIGRGKLGGNPSGVVTGDTFKWWQRMVEANKDAIVLSAHHYVLKDTTVASGEWEGFTREKGKYVSKYHGYYEQGTPRGASYLYWQDSQQDGQRFEKYLAEHPGATSFWFGGHTHTNPDDRTGGKSHIETKWGAHFLNVSALTRYHGRKHSLPMSRLLTFTEGSDEVKVQCYLHTSEFAPAGWYAKAERTLKLPRAFRLA